MKNLNLVLFAGAALLGCCASAMAAPCASQIVTGGMSCTLGDLTFTFEPVNFSGTNTGSDQISLETPPTGVLGNIDTLGFQVLATYPVDIHLIYEVQSTSTDIIALDSTFTPAPGPPAPQINESACGSDPALNQGACTPLLVNVINTTGSETLSGTFGPVSKLWVDKDITDPGFSSFTDSIEETSSAPEPGTGLLLGAALCGLGLVGRKRSNPSR
jgi:hypothetical protein